MTPDHGPELQPRPEDLPEVQALIADGWEPLEEAPIWWNLRGWCRAVDGHGAEGVDRVIAWRRLAQEQAHDRSRSPGPDSLP